MLRPALLAVVLLASPATAAPDKALLAAATAQAPAVTATLQQLVEIESGTSDAEGITALGNYLEGRFKALGATVERIKPTGNAKGDIITATLKGTGKSNLLLIGHMDTVYLHGALAKAPFHVADGKAYGPGIADDKGGLAVILHALPLLKPSDFGTITVSINTDEEAGSLGSGAIITELARGKDAVLSFEPTYVPEGTVTGTSGTAFVVATVTGKAAHAGNAPEQGINALVEAASVIERTKDLDQGPGKLRFNWTVVTQDPQGVRNIIPDTIVLTGDLRISTDAEREGFAAEIARRVAVPAVPGAVVTVKVIPGRPGYTADAASRALIDRAVAIYAGIGQKLLVGPRMGGGTDAGYAQRAGVPIIEALGLPGFGYHSKAAEYVHLDAVPRRLYLTAELIKQLGR
ncbi:MAG: M20/M25/M40 family metallo-hydrolase [Sandarakinorhabdus sp.]|nr:M20/M25/M40 family metallo-hydrolase [Sandarakinorhabdus sp.]